jgi:hypothetical protein
MPKEACKALAGLVIEVYFRGINHFADFRGYFFIG